MGFRKKLVTTGLVPIYSRRLGLNNMKEVGRSQCPLWGQVYCILLPLPAQRSLGAQGQLSSGSIGSPELGLVLLTLLLLLRVITFLHLFLAPTPCSPFSRLSNRPPPPPRIVCGCELRITNSLSVQFSSVQFSYSVVSDSLQPHESQHARHSCPSPTPGVHPDPHPSSQ